MTSGAAVAVVPMLLGASAGAPQQLRLPQPTPPPYSGVQVAAAVHAAEALRERRLRLEEQQTPPMSAISNAAAARAAAGWSLVFDEACPPQRLPIAAVLQGALIRPAARLLPRRRRVQSSRVLAMPAPSLLDSFASLDGGGALDPGSSDMGASGVRSDPSPSVVAASAVSIIAASAVGVGSGARGLRDSAAVIIVSANNEEESEALDDDDEDEGRGGEGSFDLPPPIAPPISKLQEEEEAEAARLRRVKHVTWHLDPDAHRKSRAMARAKRLGGVVGDGSPSLASKPAAAVPSFASPGGDAGAARTSTLRADREAEVAFRAIGTLVPSIPARRVRFVSVLLVAPAGSAPPLDPGLPADGGAEDGGRGGGGGSASRGTDGADNQRDTLHSSSRRGKGASPAAAAVSGSTPRKEAHDPNERKTPALWLVCDSAGSAPVAVFTQTDILHAARPLSAPASMRGFGAGGPRARACLRDHLVGAPPTASGGEGRAGEEGAPLEPPPESSLIVVTARVEWPHALVRRVEKCTQLVVHVDADFMEGATIVGVGFM